MRTRAKEQKINPSSAHITNLWAIGVSIAAVDKHLKSFHTLMTKRPSLIRIFSVIG
jgi:hypothetical protein